MTVQVGGQTGWFWRWVVLRKTRLVVAAAHGARADGVGHLAAEAVEGAALALERVDDVHRGDGLPARVLRVGDRIADDVLKEDLEDDAGLLVDEARDALDATTACQTADGRLGERRRGWVGWGEGAGGRKGGGRVSPSAR